MFHWEEIASRPSFSIEPVNRRRAFIPQFVVSSSAFLSAISAGYVHRQGGAFQFNLEVVKNLFLFFLFFF